ncbi:MAG TPA: hypothetical protein EYH05_08255 [Anaerolineae bacterium]|nr:hypothetical protein [Anaerolineae bacterium]
MYRITKLYQQPKTLFHTQDLALLWGIENKNTLYTTISRYVKKGILYRIHKGFYATKPLTELDPVELGIGYLHTFAYLSCETILFRHGIINQPPACITLVSAKSARFTIGQNHYLARQMKAEYLFNPAGIARTPQYQTASVARAVADMLYFNPGYYFDVPNLVDWDEVARIQEQVGYDQFSRATGKT